MNEVYNCENVYAKDFRVDVKNNNKRFYECDMSIRHNKKRTTKNGRKLFVFVEISFFF